MGAYMQTAEFFMNPESVPLIFPCGHVWREYSLWRGCQIVCVGGAVVGE
jgi:hypothetical protein